MGRPPTTSTTPLAPGAPATVAPGTPAPGSSEPGSTWQCRLDGKAWRARVQIYDATFGKQRADSFTLHVNGQSSLVRGQKAVPTFDDTKSYFDAAIPGSGVKVAGAGVKMTVVTQGETSMKVKLGTSRSSSASTTLAAAKKAVRAS